MGNVSAEYNVAVSLAINRRSLNCCESVTKMLSSKGKPLDDARRARRERKREREGGEKEARFTRRDAVLVNQEVEVPVALTKCQLGVEQSAIKAFAFSFGKQNPFLLRFE